jgi:hypothetical protein
MNQLVILLLLLRGVKFKWPLRPREFQTDPRKGYYFNFFSRQIPTIRWRDPLFRFGKVISNYSGDNKHGIAHTVSIHVTVHGTTPTSVNTHTAAQPVAHATQEITPACT